MRARFRSFAERLALFLFLEGAAVAGLLDPTFELDPRIQGRIDAILPLSDGAIYLGGQFTNVLGPTNVWVIRLKSDGSLDETFPPWNPADFWADGISSLEASPDRSLWITAYRWERPWETTDPTTTSFGALYVLDPDTSATVTRRTFEAFAQITLQPGVQALLWGVHGGVFSIGAFSRAYFEQIPLGSDPAPFVFPEPPVVGFWSIPGGPNHVRSVSTAANGDLLIFGPLDVQEQSSRGRADFGRFTAAGRLRWTFSWPASRFYQTLEVATAAEVPGGAVILAAIDRYPRGPGRLARIGSEGTEDLDYVGPRELTPIDQILIEPDGRLVVAGGFTKLLGVPRPGLAAFLPDGSLDLAFAPEEGLPEAPG